MARPKKLSDSDLLHVAFDVSGREGFESFTLRQVARAADVSPAALIKRFKSKERLTTLARRHRWESDLAELQEGSPQYRGLAGVRHFVSLIARTVKSKRLAEHGRAFGKEASEARTKKIVAAYFATTRATFARLLREASVDHQLIGVKDPEQLAFTLEALVQGAIFQFAFLTEHDIEQHLQSHVNTLLQPYLTIK